MFNSNNKKNNVNPNFTIKKWDVRGSTLYGNVIMMYLKIGICTA